MAGEDSGRTAYIRKYNIIVDNRPEDIWVTDDKIQAGMLKKEGKAVLIYLHEGNRDEDFSGFLYGVEEPENLDAEYLEHAYRRIRRLPCTVLETERCVVRETTVADVDDFFDIYSDPSITEYTEGLYPTKEEERRYAEEYIDKVYSFYEFGVWTVLEKASGKVIGRAGFSVRPEYDLPELGFVIGIPWQGQGYAYEVCRAILDYGFEELEFEAVQTLVEPENKKSLRLCERLGFLPKENVKMNQKEYILLKYHKN